MTTVPSRTTPKPRARRVPIFRSWSQRMGDLLAGKAEAEGGAAAGLALGAHRAAVALHDALHDGEAHAVALELGFAVQALEHAEELAGMAHVEAGAVVAHEVGAGVGVVADGDG